jgi:hypothetical protein
VNNAKLKQKSVINFLIIKPTFAFKNNHIFIGVKMKRTYIIIIAGIMLILFPGISHGQTPPDLGACSKFALFTSAGAFDNTGPTSVTGDIGSNTYAPTGFPPGTIVGVIHASDAVTLQASTDLETAYAYMSTLGGSVLGVLLGNGQTLTPGVYNTGAAATLNGTITLDAQNNPDATFYIRVGGAFATGINTTVLLINGASACNVYWQIGGQFDLGDNSSFSGNLLVDGAINLMTGSRLDGRALSRAGAISTNSNIVIYPMPANAGAITGAGEVCAGETGVIYSVTAIVNATSYIWTLPPGVIITSGAGTNSITVSFGPAATDGNFTVQGSNSCGTGTVSPAFAVTINPRPLTSAISHF